MVMVSIDGEERRRDDDGSIRTYFFLSVSMQIQPHRQVFLGVFVCPSPS